MTDKLPQRGNITVRRLSEPGMGWQAKSVTGIFFFTADSRMLFYRQGLALPV